jgi:hypothetical protein
MVLTPSWTTSSRREHGSERTTTADVPTSPLRAATWPRVQGNPLGLREHLCVPFNLQVPVFDDVPRGYRQLRGHLANLDSTYAPGNPAEGIVFHHPDGRRAKIKRKDFPRAA